MLFRSIVFMLFFSSFASSLVHAQEPRYFISTGKTLFDVRVTVVSDDQDGSGTVRFSGADCAYCDRVYSVDPTTQLEMRDYSGSIDLALLKEMTFYSGTAEVFLDDATVKEIRFVDTEE